MNQKLLSIIDILFSIGLIILVLATPFLFWLNTSEFFETPKLIVLVLDTLFLLILWLLKSITERKIRFTRTPLDLPLLVFLIAIIVSTVFSASPWTSILGSIPRVHNSLIAYTSYVILYFILVSNLKSIKLVKTIFYTLLFSGIILAILGILYYFGVNALSIIFPFAQGVTFTPTGAPFTTNIILIFLIPFLLIPLLKGESTEIVTFLGFTNTIDAKIASTVFFVSTLSLFAINIALTGSFAALIITLLITALIVFSTSTTHLKKQLQYALIPIILGFLILIGSATTIGGANNILHQRSQSYPQDPQLPFSDAWKISISAFRDSPLWGSGIGSYLTDFTFYKPIEFNQTAWWNLRFEESFDDYLGYLATLGLIGEVGLVLLTLFALSEALKVLRKTNTNSLQLALSVAVITFFLIIALHFSTLVIWILAILILAAFFAVNRESIDELELGFVPTHVSANSSEARIDVLPILLSLIILTGIGYVIYNGFYIVLADMHHRAALVAASENRVTDAFNQLSIANSLDPHVDVYHSDFAQTSFAIANAIAIAKSPSKSSPSGSLTTQDKQNITTLLNQAVNEGKIAASLNPNNPGDWEILGSIYRQISGVAQNALAFSLDSYGRAIQRDPLNPVLRMIVGGIYYSVQSYDNSIRFFSDAVTLKPDYANAYYNLAIALRAKGDLQNAVLAAQKVLSLLNPKSADYKVASNLLSNLQSQISTSSAAQKQALPQESTPSGTNLSNEGKTTSPLQNKNLPTVLNLTNPPKVATPPAVKK